MIGFQKSGPQPCFYCGNQAEGYDHVHARTRGGSNSADNLVPACPRCNSRKRQLSLEEFRLFIQITDARYPVVFYGEIDLTFPKRDYLFVASKRVRGALLNHNNSARQ